MTTLHLATMQYELIHIESEHQYWLYISDKIKTAVKQGAEMIVFPEYVTAHLLYLHQPMSHEQACHYLDQKTLAYTDFFKNACKEHNVTILAGTHICKERYGFVNKAFLFFPDGRVETQVKIHLTPEERTRWQLFRGNDLNVIQTKWGKMAILTCYDIEFPELARAAAEHGVELILCPSYTDTAYGYHRVWHCAQARAIENQLYVALSGMIGSLPEERPQVDQGYCHAGIFTPCDYPFSPTGILKMGEPERNEVVLGHIDFQQLKENRTKGAVAPFFDRRHTMYQAMSLHVIR
jgi:predicted amidohydrolase